MTLGTTGSQKVSLQISILLFYISIIWKSTLSLICMKHDQKMKRWTDAEWPKQWYLNRGGALDMNVEAAWDKGWSLVGLGLVNIILTNFDF